MNCICNSKKVAIVLVGVIVTISLLYLDEHMTIQHTFMESLEVLKIPHSEETESLSTPSNSFPTNSENTVNIILIPMGGMGNKLRCLGLMYANAHDMQFPRHIKKNIIVAPAMDFSTTNRSITYYDVYAHPTEKEWGFKHTLDVDSVLGPGKSILVTGVGKKWVNWYLQVYTSLTHWDQKVEFSTGCHQADEFKGYRNIIFASAWGWPGCPSATKYDSFLHSHYELSFPHSPPVDKDSIAIHIRGTDIPVDTNITLDHYFHAIMDMEDKNAHFYVATDETEAVRRLIKHYNINATMLESKHDRNSLEGARTSAIDMLNLARCKYMYCNNRISTYSLEAERIAYYKFNNKAHVRHICEMNGKLVLC